MKISKVWISDFLEKFDLKAEEVKEKLSSSLAEVEEIKKRGEWLGEKIVIAKIRKIVPHPHADRLKIAQVTVGKQSYSVVCGANNIREGQIVPLVLPGGKVKSPEGEIVTVKKAKIRGEESEAMMCSQLELGVGEDHTGIWILPSSWEKFLGKPLAEVLPEVKDVVWEIENKALTHRPDCFGQLGMAREVAAAFEKRFVLPEWYQENWRPSGEEGEFSLKIEVKDSQLAPRYSALVIEGVKIAPSPLWLQQRLVNVGLRPINNIVDVTNYVMMELGQPMHAFDGRKLEEGKIVVRRAQKGEKLVTLDGEERTLSEEDLVIADGKKAVALAGIMGGENSEVGDDTTVVVLEAATFDKATIRRSSMRLGVRTEASLRFEKGLDTNLTIPAIKRAAELILELCPQAKITSPLLDFYPQPRKEKQVVTTAAFVNKILGGKVPEKEMVAILNRLGLKTEKKKEKLVVTVPTFRRDIEIPEDLVEEVGRIYGYDKLPLVLPRKAISPAPVSPQWRLEKKVKEKLSALGFDEIYTYAFVGKELYQRCRLSPAELIPLQNPISPQLAFLKNSLLPSLIEKAALNAANFEKFSLFEVGRVFLYPEEKTKLPLQPKRIGGAEVDDSQQEEELFLQTKGKLEELFRRLLVKEINFHLPLTLPPFLHPGMATEIFSGKEKLGIFGVLHPLVKKEFSLSGAVTVFELEFSVLAKRREKRIHYTPPVKGALVKIDIVPQAQNWQEAEEKINRVFGKFLVRKKLIDFYQGRYTVRLWLRSCPETTGERLSQLIAKVVKE